VVLVLVSPLLRHSLLTFPLKAKLTLVTISPTIDTMKNYGLRLRLGMGLLIWWGEGVGVRESAKGATIGPLDVLL
jgi:hypothetical protein